MKIHLGGHLAWYDPQKRSSLELPLSEPTLLANLIQRLGLPPGEIAIVVVNGKVVDLDGTRIADADRVELYPPVGGG